LALELEELELAVVFLKNVFLNQLAILAVIFFGFFSSIVSPVIPPLYDSVVFSISAAPNGCAMTGFDSMISSSTTATSSTDARV